MSQYFIMVEEWNYPTESGRNIVDDFNMVNDGTTADGDETSVALDMASKLAEEEEANFEDVCRVDCLPATRYNNKNGNAPNMATNEIGYIITPSNGLDNFYYAVRLIPVTPLV